MAIRRYSNTATQASTTAAIASTDVTIALVNAAGYPAAPFTAALARGTGNEEIVLVTQLSGGTATVTRGYDGTVARAHVGGTSFLHVVSAQDFVEANAHVNATSGVHGIAGTPVGTTDAQTLTNKTLQGATHVATAASDAVVANVPSGQTKNTFVGQNNGTVTFTVSQAGLGTFAAGLNVTGPTALTGNLAVSGTTTLTGALTAATLTASGAATIAGLLTANGGVTVPAGKTLTVLGNADVAGLSTADDLFVGGVARLKHTAEPATLSGDQAYTEVYAKSDGALYVKAKSTGLATRVTRTWAMSTTWAAFQPAGLQLGDLAVRSVPGRPTEVRYYAGNDYTVQASRIDTSGGWRLFKPVVAQSWDGVGRALFQSAAAGVYQGMEVSFENFAVSFIWNGSQWIGAGQEMSTNGAVAYAFVWHRRASNVITVANGGGGANITSVVCTGYTAVALTSGDSAGNFSQCMPYPAGWNPATGNLHGVFAQPTGVFVPAGTVVRVEQSVVAYYNP